MTSKRTEPTRTKQVMASLRAPQWVHFCLLPLLGIERDGDPFTWRTALSMGVSAGALAYAYGLNAVMERSSDRSARKNPLVAAPDLARRVLAASLLCAGVAVLGSLFGQGTLALLVSLLCGTLYSTFLRAKRIPVAGVLFNTGIFIPLAFLQLADRVPASFVLELLLLVVLLIQNQLVHELADEAEDRSAGARTTAIALGSASTRRIMLGLAALFCVTSLSLSSHLTAWLLALAVVASATSVLVWVEDAAKARRLHRWTCLVGGGLLWGSSWL